MSNSFLKVNLLSESFLFITRILIQLFFPPLMLFFWGKDNFDLWLFLFAIPSFLSMFQISIIAPIRNHMLKLFKEKKYSKVNEIYQNSFFFVILNIFFISLIGLLYVIINFTNPFIQDNLYLITIAFLCLLLNLLTGCAHAALSYKGSAKKHLAIEILFDLIINLAVPISYFVLSNFEKVFLLVLILQLIKTWLLFYKIKDQNLNKFIKFKFINFKTLKEIINLSLGFNFHILSNIIKGPGLIVLLGSSNNLSLVGMISTARTMFYYLPQRFFRIFEITYFLEFSNILNTKEFNQSFRKHYLYLLASCIVALSIFIIFSFYFGEFLYNYWTNNSYNINFELIFLISLDAFVIIIGIFLVLPLQSINKYNYIGFFELIVNVAIFIILYSNNFFNDVIYSYKLIVISSCIILGIKFIYSLTILKKYVFRN